MIFNFFYVPHYLIPYSSLSLPHSAPNKIQASGTPLYRYCRTKRDCRRSPISTPVCFPRFIRQPPLILAQSSRKLSSPRGLSSSPRSLASLRAFHRANIEEFVASLLGWRTSKRPFLLILLPPSSSSSFRYATLCPCIIIIYYPSMGEKERE